MTNFNDFTDYDQIFKNEKKNGVFTPAVGTTTIRILPSWIDGTKKVFKRTGYHGYVGQYHNCPRLIDELHCPICQHSSLLWRQGNKEASRQFRAVERWYCNIIVRGQEEKGIQKFSMGKKLAERIVSFITVSLKKDITDPRTGHDIIIVKEMNAGGFANYDKTNFAYQSSPLGQMEWLNAITDLDQAFPVASYQELQTVLEEWLHPINIGIAGGGAIGSAGIVMPHSVVTPDRDEAMNIVNNIR